MTVMLLSCPALIIRKSEHSAYS